MLEKLRGLENLGFPGARLSRHIIHRAFSSPRHHSGKISLASFLTAKVTDRLRGVSRE
jgi:hypothetical protein